ncbi:hypothetical protein XENORESO_019277, partial [Xenotaenia resolanae]
MKSSPSLSQHGRARPCTVEEAKKGIATNQLRVTFIGEAGVDTGALQKEFLTDMVAGLEQRLFEGDQTGKSPKYSLLDLDHGNFR